MGSPACASAIQSVIEAVEFGTKPYPIFFTDKDCLKGQWPPQGETWPERLIGIPFDLRAQACTTDGTTPAPAYLSDTAGNGFPPIALDNCPLPVIQKMFLPTIYTYKFTAMDATPGGPNIAVQNPGAVSIDGANSGYIQQNIWVVDPSAQSANKGLVWGSSTVGPFGSPDCKYSPSPAPFVQFFDSRTNNPTFTLNSCGLPFWPSLYGIDTTLDTFTEGNLNYWTIGNQACSAPTPGAVTTNEVLGGNSDIFQCQKSSDVGYSFQDCLPSKIVAEQYLSILPLPPSLPTMCACTPGINCYDENGRCSCQDNLRLSGSLETVELVPQAGSWEFQQFVYCVGLQQFSIVGIPIQRYGNSTVACDPIVTSLCQNTAFLATNSQYNKACSCVLEQQRFNIQFAGLNLPVQCFGSACSNDDPHVYRTVNQSQGCSARLCSQIITIDGSAISAEGFQTMLCDGEEYVINNTGTSPGIVPIVTATQPSTVSLGPTFFIALGLLALMVVLLIAWGIRKWVTTKREKDKQRKLILQSVENIIAGGKQ